MRRTGVIGLSVKARIYTRMSTPPVIRTPRKNQTMNGVIRRDPIPKRMFAGLIGVVALFATCEAFGQEPTLELFASVYESKYEHLTTYRVQCEVHNRWYTEDGELERDGVEAYEYYRSGMKLGKKLFQLDQSQRMANATYWKVYRDGESRYLQYGGGRAVLGRIIAFDDADAYDMAITSPLALVGLHSGAVPSGSDQEYISSSFTADMLACFARPGTRIAPERTTVGGEECYVVEALGVEDKVLFRAWLAIEKNLAIARRETYLPGTGDLAYRVVCEDFREHAPGLFLPNRIVVDSGMPTSTTPNGPLFRVEEYRLTEVALNPSIETGAFEIEFPPGTLVDDRIAGIEYRVDKPATVTEALEEDVDRFQSRMGMAKDSPEEVDSISPMAASKGASSRAGDALPIILTASAGALFLSFCVVVYMLKRSRKAKASVKKTDE